MNFLKNALSSLQNIKYEALWQYMKHCENENRENIYNWQYGRYFHGENCGKKLLEKISYLGLISWLTSYSFFWASVFTTLSSYLCWYFCWYLLAFYFSTFSVTLMCQNAIHLIFRGIYVACVCQLSIDQTSTNSGHFYNLTTFVFSQIRLSDLIAARILRYTDFDTLIYTCAPEFDFMEKAVCLFFFF